MMKTFFLLLYFTILSCSISSYGQQVLEKKQPFLNDYKVITNIKTNGNKHTRDYLIIRELPFKIGDTIPVNEIAIQCLKAKTQIYNSNLFIEVNIDTANTLDNLTTIVVDVKERWYIFPTPQFKLTDRSFNEWYKTFNADFSRVVYGVDFTHYNFSGRRDKFNVTLLNGYARNIAVSYSNPYSNPKLTKGFNIYGSYTENKELFFNTTKTNILQRFKNGNFVRKNLNIGGGYSKRINFYKRKGVTLNVGFLYVNDSITTKYNPNYFASSNNNQTIVDIGYYITYANTDKNAYPLKGIKYNVGISKRGFGLSGGINNTTFAANFSKYISHPHHFYSSAKIAGIIKLPFKQAYINQRAIGFGNLIMRGLDLYAIDGVAASVLNYTLSKKIVAFKIPIPFNIKALPYIPFSIYAKTYADLGYSYLPNNINTNLNNKFLYTSGFGVDVLSLYDIVLKLEFSFNQLNEKGLFLRGNSNF